MNNSSFVAPGMRASMQGLWRWLTAAPASGHSPVITDPKPPEFKVSSVTNISRCGTASRCLKGPPPVRRPVRVIRVLEASQAPAQAGRMVMSGRMADVCAELDRLAAWETALH